MNILAIDIGSYSLKFLVVKSERRSFTLVEKQEIILDEIRAHYPNVQSLHELQKEVVANYLQKVGNETRIIFQIPNEFITTRYFELPVTSKKKAEQMIPFQLDDNLPYPLSQAHYASEFFKKSNSFSALTNIIQESAFKTFYQFFDLKDSLPHTVTTEISLISGMIEYLKINETALIIDLGHKTTKIYVTQNRQIVSNQLSYIAGVHFNEVIAKTYQLSVENAAIYKHENAFFLNQSMYSEVSEDQRDFAQIMKRAISPLLQDIRRAEIGHRVKHGISVEKIYLMGGTSQINNLDGFLVEHVGLPVSRIPSIKDIKNDYNDDHNQLNLARMMVLAQKNKNPIINFLSGKFQTQANTFISLHSSVFIGVRSIFIALILVAGLSVERFVFLKRDQTAMDKKIATILKSPLLNLTKPQRSSFKNQPKKLLANIKKKNQTIKQEVTTILSAQKINAVKPLAILSNIVGKNAEITMTSFENTAGDCKATFTSFNPDSLKALAANLIKSNFKNSSTQFKDGDQVLILSFTE